MVVLNDITCDYKTEPIRKGEKINNLSLRSL